LFRHVGFEELKAMRPLLIPTICSVIAVGASFAAAQEEDLLKNLRREHPRLYRSADGFAQLKRDIANDRRLTRWFDLVDHDADEFLSTLPVTFEMQCTQNSRQTVKKISTLAGVYRLKGSRPAAERAKEELLAVAKFPDWEPEGFLTCGEMTFAVALGYDWLHELLTPEERKLVREAIVEKGLKPGLKYYPRTRWAGRGDNWNQVCNGSLIVGALAVADEEPEIARQVLQEARRSLQRALDTYNPDGGWPEGPSYWQYGSIYLIRAVAALESALGNDLDIAASPGVREMGNYRIHSTGPYDYAFNYSDGDEFLVEAPHMFWLAQKYQRPDYATHESRAFATRPNIFHLIWSDALAGQRKNPSLPRDALFRNIDTAFFRSAWDDPSATYVGFKCGMNQGHGHLDYGSFILDSQQERWAIDLVGTNNSGYPPGFFGPGRWNHFRVRNQSHNTLTINNGLQNQNVRSRIVAFRSTSDRAYAVGDLSATYGLPDASIHRGIALLNRRDVLVQDELKSPKALDVVWNMHTKAAVTLEGQRASLALRGANMYARLLAPTDAVFEVGQIEMPDGESPPPDIRTLRIRLKTKTPEQRIAVLLTPSPKAKAPKLEPLEKWIKAASLANSQ
jgi:hypothetical protein